MCEACFKNEVFSHAVGFEFGVGVGVGGGGLKKV